MTWRTEIYETEDSPGTLTDSTLIETFLEVTSSCDTPAQSSPGSTDTQSGYEKVWHWRSGFHEGQRSQLDLSRSCDQSWGVVWCSAHCRGTVGGCRGGCQTSAFGRRDPRRCVCSLWEWCTDSGGWEAGKQLHTNTNNTQIIHKY